MRAVEEMDPLDALLSSARKPAESTLAIVKISLHHGAIDCNGSQFPIWVPAHLYLRGSACNGTHSARRVMGDGRRLAADRDLWQLMARTVPPANRESIITNLVGNSEQIATRL